MKQKNIFCGFFAALFWVAAVCCVHAQVPGAGPGAAALQPEGREKEKDDSFPLSDSSPSLNQTAIDDAIKEAQASDVDVTIPQALMYKGLTCNQMEQWGDGIPFLEEAIRRDPSQQAAWEGLGWAYVKTGARPRAKKLWSYFRDLMPSEALPYNLLAQEAILRGDWKDADKNFKLSLKRNASQFELRFWYAQNLLRIGETDEAEQVFRDLIKEEPDRLDIQINLANLLTHKMHYDESVEIWRHVNTELPGNPSFMLDEAALELRVGEMKAADQLCIDAWTISSNETDSAKQRNICERVVQTRTEIALVEGAGPNRIIEIINTATNMPYIQSMLYLRLANRCELVNQRNPGSYSENQILGYMKKAIDLNPDAPDAMILYAERLVRAKRYISAKKWAVRVLTEFNPYMPRAKMVLFEIALAERRFDNAEQALEDRYINFDPTAPMRFYYEARLQMFKGDYNEAMRLLDKMEAASDQGAVLTLLYHGLTESDWMPTTSVRRFQEHLFALQQEGWTFISPTDIPAYVGLKPGQNRRDPNVGKGGKPPWSARFIDGIRYELTGIRKFKPASGTGPARKKPMKVCAVTFDDGLRSAFVLGTPVAESMNIAFGMHVITVPQKEYVPSVAGWEEIREYASSGAWVIGSHLYEAHAKGYTKEDQKILRNSLPNRIWLPKKNRLESMNEWDRRMRYEFRHSRELLRKEMGENDSPVPFVAYPEGDIGQETVCNLSILRNPTRSILSEAARTYKIGFIQEPSGYTTAGDNLLQTRRYEPDWTDEGDDVVRHAYEFHPSFMARRTRVEVAFLMDRPHLASEMLDSLRRDGYPEELCREITIEVRNHFRNRPQRSIQPLMAVTTQPALETTAGGGNNDPAYNAQSLESSQAPQSVMASARDASARKDASIAANEAKAKAENSVENIYVQAGENSDARSAVRGRTSDLEQFEIASSFNEGNTDPWLRLRHPSVGGEAMHSKANDQFEIRKYTLRGSLDLNNNTQLGGEYSWMRIDQNLLPRWNSILDDYSREDDDYELSQKRYKFKAWREDWRIRLSHRFDSGAVLSGSLGEAKYRFDYNHHDYMDSSYDGLDLEDKVGSETFEWEDDDKSIIGDLTASWSPRDDLGLRLYYIRDVVVSSIKMYDSDSVGGSARWRPTDSWMMDFRTQYWSYEDDNALFYAEADSFWETIPDMGIWTGVDLSNTTSSDPSDYYWTPYWDERIVGVLRYLQSWQGYSFRFDFLAGIQQEESRTSRRSADVLYGGGSDWDVTMGFSTTYTKKLNDYIDIYMDGSVMAHHEYIDHRFLIGFNLTF